MNLYVSLGLLLFLCSAFSLPPCGPFRPNLCMREPQSCSFTFLDLPYENMSLLLNLSSCPSPPPFCLTSLGVQSSSACNIVGNVVLLNAFVEDGREIPLPTLLFPIQCSRKVPLNVCVKEGEDLSVEVMPLGEFDMEVNPLCSEPWRVVITITWDERECDCPGECI